MARTASPAVVHEVTTRSPKEVSDVVKAIQASYDVPNETFPKPPSAAAIKRWEMLDYLAYVVEGYRKDGKRRNIHIIGPSGIGKTKTVKHIGKALGVEIIVLHAPTINPDTLGLPIVTPIDPTDQDPDALETIKFRLREYLCTPGEKIIFIDEERQAHPGMLGIFMEMKSEGTVSGFAIPDLMGVVVGDNPSTDDYGDLALEDLAQADRMGTLVINSSHTAWEYGIAHAHPNLNLTKLFTLLSRLPLDARSKEYLMPRVVDNIITVLEEGCNASYGLPIYPAERMKLLDPAGNDVTSAVLDKIARAIGLPNPPVSHGDFKKILKLSMQKGYSVIAYSDPGIGKTKLVESLVEESGLNKAYFSMPTVNEENFSYAMPSKDGTKIKVIPRGELWANEPTVVIFDEATRARESAMNVVNEIGNERTCGGIPLPNVRCVILLSNLPKTGGFALDVSEITLPFASRPTFSLIVTIEDTGALEWLQKEFGLAITPFIEWRQLDLDDELRLNVSARCLERMYDHYKEGRDPARALPYINDNFVLTNLAPLYKRLGGRPDVSFLNLINETDEYERKLIESADPNPDPDLDSPGMMFHMDVYNALSRAPLTLLEEYRPVCLRMIKALAYTWRYMVLSGDPDKWSFWALILREAYPEALEKDEV
jgi:MoxR-like ATPase